MDKLIKKILLFTILNFNLFAGESLVSIGDLIINLPDGHSFQQAIKTGTPSQNRQCFNTFIVEEVSKISFPQSQKTVFEQLNELGYFTEIRLGQRSSSQIDNERFSFAMRDLGENWCDKKETIKLLNKLKKEITAKLKRILGGRLVKSLVRLNREQDPATCNCSDLSEFKFDEEAGVVYFPDRKTKVTNPELLARLYKYFYSERKANRTRHIIPGTEMLDILGGKDCLIRRYRRNEEGVSELVYCAPNPRPSSPELESSSENPSDEESEEESSGSIDETSSEVDSESETMMAEDTAEKNNKEEEDDDDASGDYQDDQDEPSQAPDDYAAAEIQRQLDSIRALEYSLEGEKGAKKPPESVYSQLHEQLEQIEVQGFSEGEDGEIYDPDGNQIHNETLIERYYDETSPPDEDFDHESELEQSHSQVESPEEEDSLDSDIDFDEQEESEVQDED